MKSYIMPKFRPGWNKDLKKDKVYLLHNGDVVSKFPSEKMAWVWLDSTNAETRDGYTIRKIGRTSK